MPYKGCTDLKLNRRACLGKSSLLKLSRVGIRTQKMDKWVIHENHGQHQKSVARRTGSLSRAGWAGPAVATSVVLRVTIKIKEDAVTTSMLEHFDQGSSLGAMQISLSVDCRILPGCQVCFALMSEALHVIWIVIKQQGDLMIGLEDGRYSYSYDNKHILLIVEQIVKTIYSRLYWHMGHIVLWWHLAL